MRHWRNFQKLQTVEFVSYNLALCVRAYVCVCAFYVCVCVCVRDRVCVNVCVCMSVGFVSVLSAGV